MKGLPSSRDVWEGIDFTETLKREKRLRWVVILLLFALELVVSVYIIFHLRRPPGVSPAEYAMAVMAGLGVPLGYNLVLFRLLGDETNLSLPSVLIYSRVAPFAVVLNWLFIVAMVFPVGVFVSPPWGVLLTNPSPFTLIGFAFVGFIASMALLARAWLALHALRMKFDRRYRQRIDWMSKVLENRR